MATTSPAVTFDDATAVSKRRRPVAIQSARSCSGNSASLFLISPIRTNSVPANIQAVY
ncbi:hypothetical protein RHEC894_PE00237 (plasmid) [Rhizobium sp. CIAT894]|nr:hypothetical protein RHEC894_PE00237 [Rhizobium sp. CIAT894]